MIGNNGNQLEGWYTLPGLVATATLIALLLGQTPWFHITENFKSDFFQVHLTPFQQPGDDIVIIGIDESTLADFAYRSPIDRGFLTDLITRIDGYAPKAIALDLLLDTRTEPDKDQQLIEALRSTASPIFIASGASEDGLTDAQVQTQEQFLKGTSRISVVLDRDRIDAVVRHFRMAVRRSETTILSLAAALAEFDPESISDSVVRLAYSGGPAAQNNPFTVYPANTVDLLPGDWFKDKFVLIGSTANSADRYRTPFVAIWGDELGSFPGVVVHAFALDQLLRDQRVRDVGPIAQIVISFILCGAGLLLLRSPLALISRAIVVLGLIGAYIAVSALVYTSHAVLLPIVVPIFAVTFSSLIYGFLLWQQDRREKVFIRGAWSQYVSPEIVHELIANPNKLRLGGEERKVTYLFTDVAGFTSLAESLPPGEVGRVLNSYLDGIFDLFREHGGTIDKIVGDAVVGMFGAPIEDEQQEQHAIGLAVAIDRYCARFSVEQKKDGITFGETRIGVNTGTALVGNFGGSGFFDYTGLGDTINAAARLESANKVFGTRICVSGSTRRDVQNIPFRKIGFVALAGKNNLIDVYEPVPSLTREHRELYEDAYADMERGLDSAVDKLQYVLVKFPNDRLVEYHLARIRENGVINTNFNFSEK